MLTSLNPNFHEAIILSLSIDFEANSVSFVLKQVLKKEATIKISNLLFEKVVWQDFRDFNAINTIWDIEMSDMSADLDHYQKGKPFSESDIARIKADKSLKYYFFTSKVGLKACIICKGVTISQSENGTVI